MDRSFTTFDEKVKRLILALKFICHIVVSLCTVDCRDDVIKVVSADLLSVFQMEPVLENFLLTRKDADDIHISDHKRVLTHPQCRFLLRHLIYAGCLTGNFPQEGVLRQRSTIPPEHDGVRILWTEAQHMISFEIRFYLHVRNVDVLLDSVLNHHINALTENVADVVDIHVSLALI